MSPVPDWARAFGSPLIDGRIRSVPEDFNVTEILEVEFTDAGEHDWLLIRKTGANTHWVAERLARFAGVPVRDVGYAGLKDRHAVAEQWFSVHCKPGSRADWARFSAEGVEIREQRSHQRKLKRGTHRGNRFRIAIRGDDIGEHAQALSGRLGVVAAAGVPNYFGEQRFGRDGANIELGRAVLEGRRLSRHKRSIGLSALRSLRFNEELASRVEEGSWNVLKSGDTANLDGSGSVFAVEDVTAELVQRCAQMDIHPCGTLPALGEAAVEARFRPLRMRVTNLEWQIGDDALWLDFRLGRGCYATAVLREIVSTDREESP